MKKQLKIQRNRLLTEIHTETRNENKIKINNALKDLENTTNDNRKMFEAIKNLNKLAPKQHLLLKTDGGLTADEKQLSQIIAEYFKTILYKNTPISENITPTPMEIKFTAEEIKSAVKKLKTIRVLARSN